MQLLESEAVSALCTVVPLAHSTGSEAPWALDTYLPVEEWVDERINMLPTSSAADSGGSTFTAQVVQVGLNRCWPAIDLAN